MISYVILWILSPPDARFTQAQYSSLCYSILHLITFDLTKTENLIQKF